MILRVGRFVEVYCGLPEANAVIHQRGEKPDPGSAASSGGSTFYTMKTGSERS